MDIDEREELVKEIERIRYQSGAMYFVGYTKGEEIGRVYINSIGGCVAVPNLLKELALKTRVKKYRWVCAENENSDKLYITKEHYSEIQAKEELLPVQKILSTEIEE